jgi:BMFP domain-containing protein YqiC
MNRPIPDPRCIEMHLLCHGFGHALSRNDAAEHSQNALFWCATFGAVRHGRAFLVHAASKSVYEMGSAIQKRCRATRGGATCQGIGALLESTSLFPDEPAMDPRFIDELARKLSVAVPQGVANIRRDLEDNFKAVLQAALSKMDLVTRQEFDVQAGVLRRTREKLEALEAKLAALESKQG